MGFASGQKKGINLYYTYRTTEFKHLTKEQIANIVLCLLELDEKGTIIEQKAELDEINENALTATVFEVMKEKNKRASDAWKRMNSMKRGKKGDAEAPDRCWLQGSDEDIMDDKDEIQLEIASNCMFANNDMLEAELQSGYLFHFIATANLSKKSITARDAIQYFIRK